MTRYRVAHPLKKKKKTKLYFGSFSFSLYLFSFGARWTGWCIYIYIYVSRWFIFLFLFHPGTRKSWPFIHTRGKREHVRERRLFFGTHEASERVMRRKKFTVTWKLYSENCEFNGNGEERRVVIYSLPLKHLPIVRKKNEERKKNDKNLKRIFFNWN